MIAPNPKQPGRNDRCPCGSGLKHKHCHGNPKVRAIRDDQIRMRTLAHLFLANLQKVTGSPAIAVAAETLTGYPMDPKIKIARDDQTGAFLFAAEPLKQPLIQAPRRIVLPRAGMG